MRKERLPEIELLRGMAFWAVVLQHVIAGVFYQPGLSGQTVLAGTTFLGLIRFAVPLFVFITGVVLFYNYDGKLNYGSFLWKRFRQIVVPYLAWTVIYYIWMSVRSGGIVMSLSSLWNELVELLRVSLTGQASYHLWFMVMIIPFYLLFPLFRLMLGKEKKLWVNLAVGVVFLGLALGLVYALSKGWITSDNAFLNTTVIRYLDRNFLFWMFYFVMGGLVGLYYKQWKMIVSRIWWLCLIGLGVFMYIIYTRIEALTQSLTSDLYIYSSYVTAPLNLLMMGTILVSMVLVFAAAERLAEHTSWLTSLLTTFGRYSFGAYLIHAMVLSSTNYLAISYLGVLGVYGQTVVSFVLCAAVSLGVCVGLSKVKGVGEGLVGRV
ncbi:acyltransferase [Paenibacillus senegalimassiliensis]|uniref:acyltransferase n=1 Tax=Paenibacillus senegalimassiliensis TaxID=1737426 RepID=UPI00073F11B1|nr:acyltransferase [Paenibacillus senegalimassiliensis]